MNRNYRRSPNSSPSHTPPQRRSLRLLERERVAFNNMTLQNAGIVPTRMSSESEFDDFDSDPDTLSFGFSQSPVVDALSPIETEQEGGDDEDDEDEFPSFGSPPMPMEAEERYESVRAKEHHYKSLEYVIGGRGALPFQTHAAIKNAQRKVKIWEKAKELRRGRVQATEMILKAYNLVWEEEGYEWNPPSMAGLRDWWGDNDEHSESIVEEFRQFLSLNRVGQRELLDFIDRKRAQWIEIELKALVRFLELSNNTQHEFAKDFMDEYGHMVGSDLFKFFVVEDEFMNCFNSEVESFSNYLEYLNVDINT